MSSNKHTINEERTCHFKCLENKFTYLKIKFSYSEIKRNDKIQSTNLLQCIATQSLGSLVFVSLFVVTNRSLCLRQHRVRQLLVPTRKEAKLCNPTSFGNRL